MRASGLLVTLAFMAASLAGCAAEPAETAPAAASMGRTFAPAPEATTTAESGSITGIVVDDEQKPLPGVRVGLATPQPRETDTDSDGVFTINAVEPGSYAIHFVRHGYEPAAKKVTIVPGEVTHVNVTLQIFLIIEGYQYSIPRTAFIKVGQWTVQHAQQTVNQSAIDDQLCDACRHVFEVPKNLTTVVMEPMWVRSSTAPMVNEKLGVGLSVSYGDGQLTSYFLIKDFTNRERYEWTEGMVKTVKTPLKFRLNIQGTAPTSGIMLQQKVDFWTTFGIDQPIDGNFTALPPA